MIILPTIYRPESLKKFTRAYHNTGASLPVLVVFENSNLCNYDIRDLPETFTCFVVSDGTRIGDIFNEVLKVLPDEDFYGIIADDVTPDTYRWDILLREACMPDKIVWGYDGGLDETLPRHPFIGGDLARRLGFLACPGLKHWFVDNAWRDIATGLGCGEYRPEIRMVHRHYTTGTAQRDRTYLNQPDPRADEITYHMWLEQDFPALVNRMRPKQGLPPVEIIF